MTARKALITGVTGQDGSLLAQHLLNQGYKITAPIRESSSLFRLQELKVATNNNLNLVAFSQSKDLDNTIKSERFDEIYHLAAMSHVGESHLNPTKVYQVNANWTEHLLETIVRESPNSKFFFASSSEIFQSTITHPVTENDVKEPSNPYGNSKLKAHLMVQHYRENKGLFASNGILFNHESTLRDQRFVSKKICREVARIVKHGGQPLSLGNLEAKKDWGYAPDFVPFFQTILTQETAEDYVLATGKLYSIKDMVNAAFLAFNYSINWSGEGLNCIATNNKKETVVNTNPQFFRPLDNRFLKGDSSKAQKHLGFNNLTPFVSWVKTMALTEYQNSV